MLTQTPVMKECDVAVIGGSLGGVAAALAALRAGARVILSEEYAWIGGQVTSQAVSALDEYRGVERFPGTQAYAAFREAIRQVYRQRFDLGPQKTGEAPLNPGNGWVSRLCFEPRVALQVLNDLLAPYLRAGQLQLYTRHRPVACQGRPDHIESVDIAGPGGRRITIRARYFLDATDLGDLLPLAGVPYVSGAEAQEDTGEPHASPDGPHPERVQSFTIGFLCQFCPGENHLIRKPRGYERFYHKQPYSLTLTNHLGREVSYNFFIPTPSRPLAFWSYRRVFDDQLLRGAEPPRDIALINWPSNDYRWGNLIDQPAKVKAAVLAEARRLSMGFFYWLQTSAARDDMMALGYPELKLLPEAMGTRSGLAQAPYVRESRRILSLRRICEQDITMACNPGRTQAAFPDSVGIGWYAMDLHACVGDERTMFADTLPFQIPLGALIPLACDNLIAACKNIGTTHLTNGAYRLQPVEWSIGEAAGALAAHCSQNALKPHQVWQSAAELAHFQTLLRQQGVNLAWPDEFFTSNEE